MRISDWSSDVCSSELRQAIFARHQLSIFAVEFCIARRAWQGRVSPFAAEAVVILPLARRELAANDIGIGDFSLRHLPVSRGRDVQARHLPPFSALRPAAGRRAHRPSDRGRAYPKGLAARDDRTRTRMN